MIRAEEARPAREVAGLARQLGTRRHALSGGPDLSSVPSMTSSCRTKSTEPNAP